jgi:nicotinate phosphoribosyltransferase
MSHRHLQVNQDHAVATDLYQLTMMYAYFTADMDTEATFEYFVRRLPNNRRFLLSCGLEQAIAALRDMHFSGETLDYLRTTPAFGAVGDPAARDSFFEWLRAFRFDCEVRAVPEGTIFFPNEPVLQVHGSLLKGQLVETYLLSILNFQTLVASKAARIRLAAPGRKLVDFGTRRAHGPQAGLLAARAAYVAGFDGTSNVLAGQTLGLPIVGTAAHAYTMAFDAEAASFAHYLDTFPDSTVLLIDTYDTLRGARRAAELGPVVKGVRLDSGDLGALAKSVRRILDERGMPDTYIVASSDLNEYKIRDLIADGAPIDAFGVGTELVTSRDDPTLAGVYKLVEKRGPDGLMPTMKFSASKPSYPGRKDLYRILDGEGRVLAGALTQVGEAAPRLGPDISAEPLLTRVFGADGPVGAPPSLDDIRARAAAQVALLPDGLRGLHGESEEPPAFHVSPGTRVKIEQCERRFSVERV